MDLGKQSLPLGNTPPDDPAQGVTELFDALQAVKSHFTTSPGNASLRASVAITAGQAVNINNGQLRLADKDLSRPAVGIAISGASPGERCKYVLMAGYMSRLSGLTAGSVYYLGTAGALLSSAPGSGLRQPLGFALSTTEMLVAVSLP